MTNPYSARAVRVPRRRPEPKMRLTEVRLRGRILVAVRAKKLPMAMLPITDLRAMRLVLPSA